MTQGSGGSQAMKLIYMDLRAQAMSQKVERSQK
jgi:hypothetical protein